MTDSSRSARSPSLDICETLRLLGGSAKEPVAAKTSTKRRANCRKPGLHRPRERDGSFHAHPLVVLRWAFVVAVREKALFSEMTRRALRIPTGRLPNRANSRERSGSIVGDPSIVRRDGFVGAVSSKRETEHCR